RETMHRHSMTLSKPRNWFPRFVFALYDWTSAYGRSYERAFTWFVLVQVLFGLVYSVSFGRFGFSLKLDMPIVLFTLSQVAKPFEFLSGRGIANPLFNFVGEKPEPYLALVTALHALISFVLFAHLLLAIRWRFRRD